MAKRRLPPTFVHYEIDGEEACVGEFHYGSASDSKVLPAGKGIKLFLTDPPYNLGFDYGEVSDNQPEEDYHQMMEEVFDSCYEAADDDAHLFIIHYPQDLAKMWPRITKKWKFHQWINWNYPANFGHSTKKWTNASRTILWLVKGTPNFYGERVVQPYRNPTDKRIKKLIHEEGRKGTNLYNWWQVNLCKNVSKDKKEYSNQIPEALLERIILCTTNLGETVADPFSGTFSTSRTAMRLGRRAWGCDLNPDVVQWRPTEDEYVHNPDIPDQQFDRAYPLYPLMEAGLTEEQFQKLAIGLINDPDVPTPILAKWVGKKTAANLRQNLGVDEVPKQVTLDAFTIAEKAQDEHVQVSKSESIDDESQHQDCITEDEMSAIIEELQIDSIEELLDKCYNKRLENLSTAKDPERWPRGPGITSDELIAERKGNAFDITKWSAEYTPLYSDGDYTVGVCRPGKEATSDYTLPSYINEYYNKDRDEIISELDYLNLDEESKKIYKRQKKETTNPDDMLPVIIRNGKTNIAQSTKEISWETATDKQKILAECERLKIPTTAPRKGLIDKILPKSASSERTNEIAKIVEVSTDQHTNKANRDLIRGILSTLSDEELKIIGGELGKDITATRDELRLRLLESGEDLEVKNFTPWTLHDLKLIISEVHDGQRCGPFLVELISLILARMAYMLDHNEKMKGHWKYAVPKTSLSILLRHIPVIHFKGIEVPLEQFLQLLDTLSINEDIKVDRLGISNLKEGEKNSGKGRVNTLLTYAHWASIQGQMVKICLFEEKYQRTGRAEIPVSELLENLKKIRFE